MWAAGPPNAVAPSFRNSSATSSSRVIGSGPLLDLWRPWVRLSGGSPAPAPFFRLKAEATRVVFGDCQGNHSQALKPCATSRRGIKHRQGIAAPVVVLFSDIVTAHVRVGRVRWPRAPFRARASAGCWIAVVLFTLGAAAGCDVNTALEHQAEARRLAARVLIEFTKAADASNRAVMADTDEASVAFAREADQATQAAQKNTDALGPLLRDLGYSDESRLLEQFVSRFAEYRAMDRRILISPSRTPTSRRSGSRSALPRRRPTRSGTRWRPSSLQFPRRTSGKPRRSSPGRSKPCARFRYCRRRTSPTPTTP